MKLVNYCNKVIEYSFYALFFLVPLFFVSNTSELFEFNKMWVTFALTIIITCAWFCKMIVERKFTIQRTPLDIPLMLFLISQAVATIFSIDPHISFWGYYSRFNGGFLSTLSYIILYYALASNFSVIEKRYINSHQDNSSSFLKRSIFFMIAALLFPLTVFLLVTMVGQSMLQVIVFLISLLISLFLFVFSLPKGFLKRLLGINLITGALVALWGFPSHFGYDPTCLIFRGTFDTSCWTDAFKPTIRIFSTLGQPAWLAAYIAVLLPLAIVLAIKISRNLKDYSHETTLNLFKDKYFLVFYFLSIVFYLNLTFTNTRAGFVAFWIAVAIFWAVVFIKKALHTQVFLRYLLLFTLTFLLCNFFFEGPLGSFNKFTLPELVNRFSAKPAVQKSQSPVTSIANDSSITDSGNIRVLVWKGAIDIWKHYPLFGTGVETFAFAYYQFRPAAHNMTSEWDYLYNKAHNEYLNYLATTGIFGLVSYLAIIAIFLFLTAKYLYTYINLSSHAQGASSEDKNTFYLVLALLVGFISILISNFFGFSVVIMNLYLFLIPIIVLYIAGFINPAKVFVFPKLRIANSSPAILTPYQLVGIGMLTIIGIYFLFTLLIFWLADVSYAMGYNLDHAGDYQHAFSYLSDAIQLRSDEPVFKDELAIDTAALGTAFLLQKDITNGQQFADEAVKLNDNSLASSPHNVVFWKDRVRIFYFLSQANLKKYLPQALDAAKKANQLAPSDAKISYNLGLLYDENGDVEKGIEVMENTIKLKPDYRDAHFALGLFYHEQAIDKNNNVINPNAQEKAIAQMEYILKNISPTDTDAQKNLKSWGVL